MTVRNAIFNAIMYTLAIGGLIFSIFVMIDGAIEQDILNKKAASSVDWAGSLCSSCGSTLIDHFYNSDGIAIGRCFNCGAEEAV